MGTGATCMAQGASTSRSAQTADAAGLIAPTDRAMGRLSPSASGPVTCAPCRRRALTPLSGRLCSRACPFGCGTGELRRCMHLVADGERIVHHLYLVLRRRVVGIDLCGRGVGVSEELLNRPERLPRRCEAGSERVAQVVEPHDAHVGLATRCLEAPRDLRAVERAATLRVGKDEIVIRGVGRALRKAVQLAREAIGERHRATRREVGLALAGVLAPHVDVAYADALRRPVDVTPT